MKDLGRPTRRGWLQRPAGGYPATALAAGGIVALIGAGYLAAWLAGWMGGRGNETITIKTNAALCLLLLGIALVLLVPGKVGTGRRWAAWACAGLALLIGGVTLQENLFGADLGVDQLLASEAAGALGVSAPNRMGTPASLGIVLVGFALLWLDVGCKRWFRLSEGLALAACLVGLLGTIGYLFSSIELYGITRFTAIAQPMALALLMLGVGVLCARPTVGLMARVTADDPGGLLLRWLLLPVIVMPIALGGLHLAGERGGLYDPALGTALLVLAFIVIFVFVVYLVSRRVAQLAAELVNWAQFPQENPSPVLRMDRHGQVLYANRAAELLLLREGWQLGQPAMAEWREMAGTALAKRTRQEMEVVCRDQRVIAFLCSPVIEKDYVNFYGHDITERKQAEEALRQSEARLATTLENLAEGVVVADSAGNVVQINRAGLAMHGFHRPEECRHLSQLAEVFELATIDGTVLSLEQWPVPRIFRGETVQDWELRYRLRNRDWQRIFSYSGSLVRNREGEPMLVVLSISDITQRKRMEEELAAAKHSAECAKATAEKANQAKDHFLAVLSHELRTPLTPVAMGVALLQEQPGLGDDTRETLEMIRRNVEMEAGLIDDLLDITRIARGKIELNRRPVELSTVIQRAIEVCLPDIEERGLHLRVDLGPDAPYWIEADVPRLQQVLWNILKNAVKFTPEGGAVGVRCGLNQDHVVVEVHDSGIGIVPEVLPRIFNAFEQAERSITSQFGGLGLGLAISKTLVEMHGGQIEASSEGLGKGARFCVRLPLTAPAGQVQAPVATESPREAIGALRILLVEDHRITAKMIGQVLEAEGYRVEIAGNVATALALAEHQEFDLLISDLGLPDGSGHDLMRQLRRQGLRFPGIALSGYGQEEDVRLSYQADFCAHLIKPASREAVLNAVVSAIVGKTKDERQFQG